MKNKAAIACALALYLFVGLSGLFRFPAPFKYWRTTTTYYDASEGRERTENIRCRGLPVVFSYCTGTIEAPREDAPSTRRGAGS